MHCCGIGHVPIRHPLPMTQHLLQPCPLLVRDELPQLLLDLGAPSKRVADEGIRVTVALAHTVLEQVAELLRGAITTVERKGCAVRGERDMPVACVVQAPILGNRGLVVGGYSQGDVVGDVRVLRAHQLVVEG